MQRRIKKQFWLSPQDARELKRKAKLCGITETAVIRILLHGYEPKEKPDARFYEASAFRHRQQYQPACRESKRPRLYRRIDAESGSVTLAQISGGHRGSVSPSR